MFLIIIIICSIGEDFYKLYFVFYIHLTWQISVKNAIKRKKQVRTSVSCNPRIQLIGILEKPGPDFQTQASTTSYLQHRLYAWSLGFQRSQFCFSIFLLLTVAPSSLILLLLPRLLLVITFSCFLWRTGTVSKFLHWKGLVCRLIYISSGQ